MYFYRFKASFGRFSEIPKQLIGSQVKVGSLSTNLHELHGDELEPLLLEPLDDVAHEAALHAVRLDHDEGALVISHLKVIKWDKNYVDQDSFSVVNKTEKTKYRS